MKTHIYKVYKAAASTLLLTAALAACTDSREPMQENETPREGIFFSVTATQGEGAETRVTHTPNGDQGIDVKWASGDVIYVGKNVIGYLDRGILSPLTLKPGDEGGTTAQFEGTISNEHLPTEGNPLYAVYGKAEKIYVSDSKIRCKYTGQRQTANGDMKHLAEYDFMKASTNYLPAAGTPHFNFSHVGSMMKFTLDGLAGQKVNKLTLCTYDGSLAFVEGVGSIASVSLDLGTGSGFLVENGTLEAYLMLGETTKTAGKDLVLYVTTTGGKSFAILLTGANIDAGKIYTVEATLTEYTFEGDGNSTTPYKIKDAGDLTKLAVMTNIGMMDTQDKYFELVRDIDMSMGAEAWFPIGRNTKPFKGTFLGGNSSSGYHSILHLPNKTIGGYAGLFGYLDGATIKNVTVNGEITISGVSGKKYVGGIAGYAKSSTIANCVSNCTVDISGTGNSFAGGIIGYALNGNSVTDCTNTGKVSSNSFSGGIIGQAENAGGILNCTNCTNSGNITTTSTEYPAGGIIGYMFASNTNSRFTLTDCTHSGDVPAPNTAGSIIGSYFIPWSCASDSETTNSKITITNSGGNGSIPGNLDQDVTGKWPATDLN